MIEKFGRLIETHSEAIIKWSVTTGLRLAVIIAVFVALFFLLRLALRKFIAYYLRKESEGSEKQKRVQTMTQVLSVGGAVVLIATAIMMVIQELGIDIKPLLASLGIGGLAVGFGAQSLVKDIISGFFIIFENQVRVGDVVEVAGRMGVVDKVGLRVIVLRDMGGNRIIIPNGEINQVVNMTYEYSCYLFDIGVAYKEDVDRVIEVIKKTGETMMDDPEFEPLILEPIEVLGLDKFDDSAVVIRARYTTMPFKQWIVGREFNRRLKKAFDEQGIEIPFPHRTLYLGADQAEEISRALKK